MATTHRREVAENYARWHEVLGALTIDPPDEPLPAILHRVAAAACAVLDCRRAVIIVEDESGSLDHVVPFDAEPDAPGEGTTDLLGLPIAYDGRTVGGLYLSGPARHQAFTESDEQAAGLIAAGLSAAVRRIRQARANETRQRWLSEAAELTRELLAGEPTEPMRLVVDRVQAMADADLVAVITERADGETFEVLDAAGEYAERVRGRILEPTATLAAEVIAAGQTRVFEQLSRSARQVELVAVVGAETAVLVPLAAPGSRRGMLAVMRRAERPPFTRTDIELTTMFATQIGLALQLIESRLHRERVALLDERDRIARDLHDHVIQRLFAVGLTVQGVGTQVDGESAKRLLATVEDIDTAIAQIRSTIYRLSGPVLSAESSLRVQVARLLEELEPVLGFRVELEIRGPVDFALDDDLAHDCLAVLREALTNVARHAHATSAAVVIAIGGGQLVLEVHDDGRGVGAQSRRSGLANLRVRAQRRGGSLLLASGDAHGTRVSWTVPWHGGG